VKHLDLFSGIGGFALAARWVDWETVGFCEIDPYCQKVLRKHWPDVPIYDDVRSLAGETVGHVDIITGGYPCQPFSLAGKRRGAKDDRHLWPEFARLIHELRPAWIVGENVAGHITMGLDEVLSDLEGCGYTAETFVIPACATDAPHRRDRLWITANRISKRGRPNAGAQSRSEEESEELQQENRQALPGDAEKIRADVADPKNVQCDGSDSKPGCEISEPRDSGSASGGHQDWTIESDVGRVANGIPKRVDRLRGLGNAIVPQVAEVIFRAIVASDPDNQEKKVAPDSTQPRTESDGETDSASQCRHSKLTELGEPVICNHCNTASTHQKPADGDLIVGGMAYDD